MSCWRTPALGRWRAVRRLLLVATLLAAAVAGQPHLADGTQRLWLPAPPADSQVCPPTSSAVGALCELTHFVVVPERRRVSATGLGGWLLSVCLPSPPLPSASACHPCYCLN